MVLILKSITLIISVKFLLQYYVTLIHQNLGFVTRNLYADVILSHSRIRSFKIFYLLHFHTLALTLRQLNRAQLAQLVLFFFFLRLHVAFSLFLTPSLTIKIMLHFALFCPVFRRAQSSF